MDDIQSTRKILTSHISVPITHLSSRQKEVVQKMLFLEPKQFQELLIDIQDEIKRREHNKKQPLSRSEKFTFQRNKSRQNLSKLRADEFENLTIDVLLVLNHRYPNLESKNVDEIECLIDDLDKLITDLKGDMAYEQLVIEQINNEKDLKIRLHIYNKYVKRILEKHDEDTSVVDCVDGILKCEDDTDSVSLFDLMDTNVFLKQTDKYFKKMNMYMEEYDYHHGNLVTLIDEKIFSTDVHEKIIRKEKKSLFELMLKIDKKSKRKEFSIEKEINTIIATLSTIKDLLQSGENGEYIKVAKNAMDAVDSLTKKLENAKNVDTELVEQLFKTREDLNIQISDENIEDIPLSIFNMASLVKSILHSMPVSSLK